jgi:hypothetical protein
MENRMHLAGLRRDPPSNTLLVFFFSGFGLQSGGTDYLIPVIGNIELNQDNLASKALNLGELRKNMSNCAAASVLILDTQFTNPISRLWRLGCTAITIERYASVAAADPRSHEEEQWRQDHQRVRVLAHSRCNSGFGFVLNTA